MILLVDQYSQESERLHVSLQRAGYDVKVISISYEGFLPDGVMSPYADIQEGEPENPLYFDKLKVPGLWEIRASGSAGEVFDYEDVRGKLFYAKPLVKRHVRIVDWLDRRGIVRSSDHYDKYGRRFSQTAIDADQHPAMRTYYDRNDRERVVENLFTGDVIVTIDGRSRFFHSKAEFAAWFLEEQNLTGERIIYNSLSTCFFAADLVRKRHVLSKGDVLFWQEPIGADLPGNMKVILNDASKSTSQIVVQTPGVYERIAQLGTNMAMFRKLGYIYPFVRKNQGTANVIIHTNSDQIEQLEYIADSLPEVSFHVCAITEMSTKLLSLGQKDNIHLYPTVKMKKVEELMNRCDIYLDINNGGEILNAVEEAFLHEQVIFAFTKTVHNLRFEPAHAIFLPDRVDDMIQAIRDVIQDRDIMDAMIEAQKEYAMASTPEEYHQVLGEG